MEVETLTAGGRGEIDRSKNSLWKGDRESARDPRDPEIDNYFIFN
jgi:hypothetical protein